MDPRNTLIIYRYFYSITFKILFNITIVYPLLIGGDDFIVEPLPRESGM